MAKEDVPELQSIWDDARGFIERGDFDKAKEYWQRAQELYEEMDMKGQLRQVQSWLERND